MMRSAFFHQEVFCPPSKILLSVGQLFALLMGL
ncbi:hypothetical protein VCHC50A1_1685, partial [Vibrio cholerae HC-50A1]